MEVKKLLIAGLPGSGKTTFLAALWHVVESEEVEDSLVISEVHGVRDHLNLIREQWLNCQELERTKISAEKLVSFRLRDRTNNKVVEVTLPDLSGETFRHQWESRQWTAEFDALASQSSGVALFIHPRTVIEPTRIDSGTAAMMDALSPESVALSRGDAPGTNSELAINPWSATETCTQVKLVEILQFLKNRAFVGLPLPVAIVISAWDLIKDESTPPSWLQKRLPLLDQFLKANVESLPFQVFGVSALGDELAQAASLQKHDKASDRIIVTETAEKASHDITIPLKWLLGR
jgi:hypothetical protein